MPKSRIDWQSSNYDITASFEHMIPVDADPERPDRRFWNTRREEIVLLRRQVCDKARIKSGTMTTYGVWRCTTAFPHKETADRVVQALRELGFRNITVTETQTTRLEHVYEEYDT